MKENISFEEKLEFYEKFSHFCFVVHKILLQRFILPPYPDTLHGKFCEETR